MIEENVIDNTPLVYTRFKDASWFDQEYFKKSIGSVIIGGAGGIGSWLTLFLSRIGLDIVLYDFDKYELHNIGGQLFNISNVGNYKTESTKKLVEQLGCINTVDCDNNKITEEYGMVSKFCFSAFDNMEARKILFNKWLKNYSNDKDAIFIDGRLLAENLQIFCVTTNEKDIELYKEQLFDDSEVEDAICSMKQTSHVAAMISSLMTSFFTNHLSNIINNNRHRKVPFYHEHFLPMNFIKKELD